MNKAIEVARIEKEATEVRLTPTKLCEKAGIAETTWWRNRKNPESMTLDTLDKLERAIAREKLERANMTV